MKIVAILDVDVSVGGGFHQALASISLMQQLSQDNVEFAAITTLRHNLPAVHALGVACDHVPIRWRDELLVRIASSSWWRTLQRSLRVVGPLEKHLMRAGCSLVYFVTPSRLAASLQQLNYIATVLDLSHRDTPEFPEVREFGMFAAREHQLRTTLPAAQTIVADSPELADAIVRRYGVDPDRIVVVPFAPAPFMRTSPPANVTTTLAKYQLSEGYFFYPAQFWAHKNHVRIVEAAQLLKAEGIECRVVFAGGDRGNLDHIQRAVGAYGLQADIRFLGLVPSQDMRALYQGCAAVVMPTYFGPTNMPPLEAWLADKPLIYTDRFRDQVGDAALFADPDDAAALAQAMRDSFDPDTRARLIAAGRRRMGELECARQKGATKLQRRVRQFGAIRSSWE